VAIIEESMAPAVSVVPSDLSQRVFSLAWPIIAENGLETLLGVVDTMLVAHLANSAIALAGVGGAVQAMQFLLSALAALSIGASVLVAQAVGAKDLTRANSLARQALVWSIILAIPLAAGGFLVPDLVIGLFGLEPAAAAIGVQYMRVTMGTAVVLTGLFIGSGVLRGAGDSRTPMLITTIANIINVPLAYVLIYGILGIPGMGAVGSAWATFIARAIALVMLLYVLWRGRNNAGIHIRSKSGWRPDVSVVRRVLKIGIPAAFEQILTTMAFIAGTIVIGHLGTTIFAANRIYFTALAMSFLPGIGFAIAATALMGQSIGAKRLDDGEAVVRTATRGAMVWMGIMGLLLALFATQAMGLFTNDAAVIELGAGGLRGAAFAMPVLAIVFVYGGGMRGTGDTRTPLWIFGIGVWASVLLGSLGLTIIGGGLVTTALAWVIVSPVMAWFSVTRFKARMRKLRAMTPEQVAA
jgi:multidrug resistance protein, MATE family